MNFEVILNSKQKNYIVDILEKFLKDWALNKKYFAGNEDLEILRSPFVTFNDLLIVSIHRNFY